MKNLLKTLLLTCILKFAWISVFAQPKAELLQKNLVYEQIERNYYLYIPKALPSDSSVSLLFVLHGAGGNGKAINALTMNRFNELADIEKFIIVYPDGFNKHWNDGRIHSERKGSIAANIDDVGYIRTLIDAISDDYAVDEKRIYAAGISNGAIMSLRLACELSDKFAAVAVVAGSMPVELYSVCNPQSDVSIMIINGTDDKLIPYDGGTIQFNGKEKGRIISTNMLVNFWISKNKCLDKEQARLPHTAPDDGTTVWRETYTNSLQTTAVTLYRIEGGGHTWPGGVQYLSEKRIGKTSRDLIACDVIWKFFMVHYK